MQQRATSSIRLTNMVFYAHHGVLPEEHVLGAKYEVDAELTFDFTEAALGDDISKTIDYGIVYARIQQTITRKRHALIETAAREIAAQLLADFPRLERARTRVRKHHPPVGGLCDYAEADYTLSRS